MSLSVGELFVNLGIKGSEKTLGSIAGVKKGMSETASVSLEAKAAIVGAMYALERFFAASGARGTSLTNFNALTGLSAKQLQQWQYAARQAGVANEEFAGSLKAVQTGMTNMLLGKGAPEGMALVANKVGFDPKRARDTFYVMEQLQKFAKTVPADVGNSVLKTFGISEGTIAAMRRNAFNAQAFSKAPVYSDSQFQALDRANIAWSNLGQKIEMAIGKFNAKHGGQLVKDISIMVDAVLKLADALEKVATRFKLIQTLGMALSGIANTLKLVSEIFDKFQGKESEKGDLLYKKPGQEMFPGFKDSPVGKFLSDLFGGNEKKTSEPTIPSPFDRSIAHPSVKKGQAQSSQQNVNINQNLNFQHDGKDHKRTGDSVKKANQDAFRQFNLGQVS